MNKAKDNAMGTMPKVTRAEAERPKDSLPLITAEVKGARNVEMWKDQLLSILKKQIVQAVTGAPNNLNDQLTGFISGLWHDGYDTGLAHMDRMHSKVDQELKNG